MNKMLISPVLLILAGLVYYFFISDLLITRGTLAAHNRELAETIVKVTEFEKLKQELSQKRSEISDTDLARLEVMLPTDLDEIRLILNIQNLALANGLVMTGGVSVESQNISTGQDEGEEAETLEGPALGVISFSTSLLGSYDEMTRFVNELAKSLTLLDVVSISFGSAEGDNGVASSVQNYGLTIQTYELITRETE